MSIFREFSRRFQQIGFLINPPENLRRRHARHYVDFEVVVTVNGQPSKQRAQDVSSGGILVTPGFNASIREQVRVTISGLLRDVPARVIGLRPNGTALQFESETHGDLLATWLSEVPPLRKS